jgi:hypothetical protein
MTATPVQSSAPSISLATLRTILAERTAAEPACACRLTRAATIVALRTVERTAAGWIVESETTPGINYLVWSDGYGPHCFCPDYRERGGSCKHILAVQLLRACEQREAGVLAFPAPRDYRDDEPIPYTLTELGYRTAGEPTPAA